MIAAVQCLKLCGYLNDDREGQSETLDEENVDDRLEEREGRHLEASDDESDDLAYDALNWVPFVHYGA